MENLQSIAMIGAAFGSGVVTTLGWVVYKVASYRREQKQAPVPQIAVPQMIAVTRPSTPDWIQIGPHYIVGEAAVCPTCRVFRREIEVQVSEYPGYLAAACPNGHVWNIQIPGEPS